MKCKNGNNLAWHDRCTAREDCSWPGHRDHVWNFPMIFTFVILALVSIFVIKQFCEDITPVPSTGSGIGRYWKVESDDVTYPDYDYFEYDGERLAALENKGSYFEVLLFCDYDVLHTKSINVYDTLKNAEQFAERTCQEKP